MKNEVIDDDVELSSGCEPKHVALEIDHLSKSSWTVPKSSSLVISHLLEGMREPNSFILTMDKLQTHYICSSNKLFFIPSTAFNGNNQGHSSHYVLLTWVI